jgi:hypothetical protein
MVRHEVVVAKKPPGWPVSDDPAGVEQDGPRAGLGGKGKVVCGEKTGRLQAPKNRDELSARSRVEAARGLIQDENFGIVGEQPREGDALLFTAAEPVRQAGLVVLQTNLCERLGDARMERRPSETELARPERDVLSYRWAKELIVGILKEQAHVAPRALRGLRVHSLIEDNDFALAMTATGLGKEPGNVEQKSRFSRTIRPE